KPGSAKVETEALSFNHCKNGQKLTPVGHFLAAIQLQIGLIKMHATGDRHEVRIRPVRQVWPV
ncbi:MAG: hypothetical protein Q8L76_09735, partial [Cypionkella sp.]|nr:hypothetical protein [Cypionkella sp.]